MSKLKSLKKLAVKREGFSDFKVYSDSNVPGVRVVVGSFSYKPHATLFAASKEMLSALKSAAEDLRVMCDNYGEGEDHDLVKETLDHVESAIKKAERK